MSANPTPIRRRTFFVNPRLQAGAALLPAAAVLAGGILFAGIFHAECRDVLRAASFRGHFFFRTPYDLVGALMVRRLAALFAFVTVAGGALLLLHLRRIGAGLARVAEVLRISAEGDLSSTADSPGPRSIGVLGSQVDGVRGHVLGLIGEVRAEVDLLRRESLPQDEFLRRWEGLKAKIGRIAP